MNKADLVKAIAQRTEMSMKDAQRGLDMTLHIIRETLKKGEKLTLVGFGTFTTYKRKERVVRNPHSGKTMKVKAKRVARFKAGKFLAESVHKTK